MDRKWPRRPVIGAPALGRGQHDMSARREAEASPGTLDQGRAILRHDAEMVTGAIADAVGSRTSICRVLRPDSRDLQPRDWPGPDRQGACRADQRMSRRVCRSPDVIERFMREAGFAFELDTELAGQRRQ